MHRLLHTRPNKLEFPKSLPHNTGLVHLSAAVEDPKPEKNQRNTNKSRPSQFRAFFRPPKYRRLSLLLVRAPPGPLLCENYKTAYCGFSICTRTWHLGLTRREGAAFTLDSDITLPKPVFGSNPRGSYDVLPPSMRDAYARIVFIFSVTLWARLFFCPIVGSPLGPLGRVGLGPWSSGPWSGPLVPWSHGPCPNGLRQNATLQITIPNSLRSPGPCVPWFLMQRRLSTS